MATKGYTPEVEEVYARTLELFEGRQVPQLFPVLRNLGNFYNFRGESENATRMARAILRLGEEQQDASMLVDGHLFMGMNLAFFGDLHAGLEHLDTAIAYFRSGPYPAGRYRLGNNPGVVCLTSSAFILWVLGHPDRGRQRADEAVALAAGLEHPLTLAYGLYHAGYLHLWRREPDLVRERADRLLRLVDEHDFPIWRALGTCLLGAADTAVGQVEQGRAKVRQGVDLYQGQKTPPVFWPMLRALEAGAYAQAGRVEEGLVMVDEALEIAGRGPGTTVLPEFQLLKGDLLLALGQGDGADPEPWFRRAFDRAQRLDSRMSQLRAAVRLRRLRSGRDAGDSSRPAARRLRHLHRRLRHRRSDRGTSPARTQLGSADDRGEAGWALLDKAGRFPVLMQDHEGRGVDPAGGGAGQRVDGMGRADRSGPSHPEDRVGTMHHCGNRLELLRTSLVAH